MRVFSVLYVFLLLCVCTTVICNHASLPPTAPANSGDFSSGNSLLIITPTQWGQISPPVCHAFTLHCHVCIGIPNPSHFPHDGDNAKVMPGYPPPCSQAGGGDVRWLKMTCALPVSLCALLVKIYDVPSATMTHFLFK